MQRLAVTIGVATSTAACLLFETSLPQRPASLEQSGVRLGDGWLHRTVLHEDARLGSVTQIRRRPASGELAVVGTRSALFLPATRGTPRVVEFQRPSGEVELVDWPHGGPRYLDRGGGGWQRGALIAEDGGTLWQPDSGMGMNDMAAGDLDGDELPEFVVGYNGGGGVHLLDATGKPRWRRSDDNVWHVEIVDTDGDGRPEIVHSNAGGLLTVRDASGEVLKRANADSYFSQFSVVQWPSGRTGLLHAGDDATSIVDFDGRLRSRFETPDTSFLADARGVAVRLDGTDHLVLAVSQSNWDRTQLFVFDHGGIARYREILAGTCGSLAALDVRSFLFGCHDRVYRYATKP